MDANGKFLALRTRNVSNMGAYLSTFAPYIPTYAGTGVLASIYGFKAIHANVLGVFTNTVPVDAYRGAEANYLVERLVDAAARDMKIDRVGTASSQHGAALGHALLDAGRKTYDSGDFRIVLDAALTKIDYAGFTPAAPKRRHAASGAASGLRIILRRPAATRPSGPRSASPRMASSMSMSARSRRGRGMKPPMSS